jgi:C4-dicarboxylate-specific signal transduction histidine kinase/ActR/RegA family two-component response regulator
MAGSLNYFASVEFMPHGHCYFWRTDLMTLQVASDSVIAFSYYAIPVIFAYLIRRRSDLPFPRLFWLFGLFIVGCGTTHLMEVYTVWNPAYWLSGWIKAGTAVVSLLSAVALVRVVPEALLLPSPDVLKKLNEGLERRVQERTIDLTASNERLEREIRQREQAEAEVRRLNDSLQNRVTELQVLLDLLPVGIAIAQDVQTRELRTNQAFARLTGIVAQQEASLSAPPIEVPANYKVFQGDRELSHDELPLRRALTENQSVLDVELRLVRFDQQEFQVLASAVPLRDQAGKARGAVTTLQDITAQKRAGQELLAVERRLQETQKLESLGVLAGGIAHDFNNLLTGILGNASLARLDLPPGYASVRVSLDNLEQATVRAADLCKQMLAYAGRGRFVIQPLNLSRLVRETAELLEVSLGRKATLKLDLAEGLPAFQGDATQVRQILMNLVLNASEALGDKGGVITVRTNVVEATREYLEKAKFSERAEEGRYVFVDVSDNGCGMDAATRAKIFDPFFTTKFTGRGLGLAAVLGIVRGHKGAIQVYSEPGRGTTFKVFFPALDKPATPPAPVLQAAAEKGGFGTILVVDDEATVRRVAEQILLSAGYEVVLADDGARGIELFRQSPSRFSAVLLDLTMPRMDGEEAFRVLQEVAPDVCVVLMSGFNEQDTLDRFAGRGVAGFVPKPFSAEMLRSKLHEAIAKKSPR